MKDRALDRVVRERDGKPWCLFLDRDGVINIRILDGYVRNWAEFQFVPGALAALATLASWAPQIVVVTNQQGVGKGLMTRDDLDHVHERMRRVVIEAGGRIDAVLSCPHLVRNECDCRKPNTGMAEAFLDAHSGIDGALSVMIGDTGSDIEMGHRLAIITGGCTTVRIDGAPDPLADMTFESLAAFAAEIGAILDVAPAAMDHSAE